MRTALDAPLNALDDGEQRFVTKIREHGWFRTGVLAEAQSPGFSYTTGFWLSTGMPEVTMFGLRDDIAHDVFWDLYRDAQAGRSLPVGASTNEVFANIPAYAFPVAKRFYPN